MRARVEYISRVDPDLAVFNEGHIREFAPLASTAGGAVDIDRDGVLVGANDALYFILLVSVSKISEGECPVLLKKVMISYDRNDEQLLGSGIFLNTLHY